MWSFFTGWTKQGKNGEGPVASCTILGWVLSGPVSGESENPRLSSETRKSPNGGTTLPSFGPGLHWNSRQRDCARNVSGEHIICKRALLCDGSPEREARPPS